MKKFWLITFVLVLTLAGVFAQRRRGFYGGGSESYVPPDARTARDAEQHSVLTPMWTNALGFEKDVFTFCRIKRDSKGGAGNWTTDTPDSDLNLSYRLQ